MGHLTDSSIEALRVAKIPQVCIEMFNHYSYCAAAINNSRNPAKAAVTLLGRDNIQDELRRFIKRTRLDKPELPEIPGRTLALLKDMGVSATEAYKDEPEPEDIGDREAAGIHGPFGRSDED